MFWFLQCGSVRNASLTPRRPGEWVVLASWCLLTAWGDADCRGARLAFLVLRPGLPSAAVLVPEAGSLGHSEVPQPLAGSRPACWAVIITSGVLPCPCSDEIRVGGSCEDHRTAGAAGARGSRCWLAEANSHWSQVGASGRSPPTRGCAFLPLQSCMTPFLTIFLIYSIICADSEFAVLSINYNPLFCHILMVKLFQVWLWGAPAGQLCACSL